MVALNGKALRPTAHGTAPSAPKVDALAKIRTNSQAATFVTLGEAVSNGSEFEMFGGDEFVCTRLRIVIAWSGRACPPCVCSHGRAL